MTSVPGTLSLNLTVPPFPCARALPAQTIRKENNNGSHLAARDAPALLIGTIEEMKRGIRSRIEELGCTWFKMIFPAVEFAQVFAKKIMPEFV